MENEINCNRTKPQKNPKWKLHIVCSYLYLYISYIGITAYFMYRLPREADTFKCTIVIIETIAFGVAFTLINYKLIEKYVPTYLLHLLERLMAIIFVIYLIYVYFKIYKMY